MATIMSLPFLKRKLSLFRYKLLFNDQYPSRSQARSLNRSSSILDIIAQQRSTTNQSPNKSLSNQIRTLGRRVRMIIGEIAVDSRHGQRLVRRERISVVIDIIHLCICGGGLC